MTSKVVLALMLTSGLALAGCGNASDAPVAETETDSPAPVADTAPADAESAPDVMPSAMSITDVLAGDWRGGSARRDEWRNPAETLEFFGLDGSETIIEIWPGGGWYANVLAPWTAGNGGTYVAAHFPADTASEYRQNARTRFIERYSDTSVYGDIVMGEFDETSGEIIEAGTADAVLTFRNVHNWMAGGWAEKAFGDFYTVLKPGGVLGVVEHRLPSTREQDPQARSGYVQEAYVIAMAEEAGFEYVGSSEINANPADTADHPFGVWTLPPVRRSAARGEEMAADFDRAGYDAIGESDRMTLLFRKPADAE